MVAPRGTPGPQTAFWENALARVVETEEWKRMLEDDVLTPHFLKSAETKAYLNAQYEELRRALAALGTKKSWVVHGFDGLDEITLADKTTVAEAANGCVRTFEIEPADLGLGRASLESVRGGDAENSARIIREVIGAERRDEARDLVVINAAAGLFVGGRAADLNEARHQAEKSIDEGAAHAKLDELIKATNE
jgi:anthranilate phosphoribosyltransferase